MAKPRHKMFALYAKQLWQNYQDSEFGVYKKYQIWQNTLTHPNIYQNWVKFWKLFPWKDIWKMFQDPTGD